MHKSYCTCPKCRNRKLGTKIGLGIGIPVFALILTVFVIIPGSQNESALTKLPSDLKDLSNPAIQTPLSQEVQKETQQETSQQDPQTSYSVSPSSQQHSSFTAGEQLTKLYSPDELREYALQRINKDREAAGLKPVILSENQAAQLHAEDVLKTRQISHWMTNGEKPYMTYSRLGGTGYVAQNVYVNGYENSESCNSGYVICPALDAIEQIDNGEYAMMNEDQVCCQNGHHDNILDHTDVSIGIAYNSQFFVLVQNFENNYIKYSSPITSEKHQLQIDGVLPSGLTLNSIMIEYDPLPASDTYEANKNMGSYGGGETIAGVIQPGYHFSDSDIQTLKASNWSQQGQVVDVKFDLSGLKELKKVSIPL